MNACPPPDQLRRLLAEELTQPERAPVELHVEHCPHCQHTLEELATDSRLVASDASADAPLLFLRGKSGDSSHTTEFGAAPADDPVTLGFLAPATRPDSLGRLGHYEILDVLGKGGFGIVLRAFDDTLHRVVAIKVLAPAMAAMSPARKRFLREARAAAQVRHENVVQIYAVEEQPLPYLVMEYLPGETLQHRLNRTGPFEVAEVVAIGRQIAEGLGAAHAAGLIHRDVKPANVLVEQGPRLRIKVTDFGLARAADDASVTQSGVVAGTPLYMSPEQAKGERLDYRADLFSLGSVLYAITSGRPPFRAGNTLAVLKRVAEDTPRPIPQIIPETPAWLCGVIGKLMAKQPADRFQNAADLSAALAAGPSGPLIMHSHVGSSRRRQWWSVAVGMAVVALAVFTVILIIARVIPSGEAQKVTEPPVAPPAPAPVPSRVDLDRAAAEWTVSRGGFVRTSLDPVDIRHPDDLPPEPFALTVVDLGGVNITDDELGHLERLKRVEILSLAATQVTDAGFVHLGELTKLRVLHMGGIRVTGSGFAHFKDLQRLTEIWAEATPLNDQGLSFLQNLRRLNKLGAGRSKVTDAGMHHLAKYKTLSELWLDGTDVTDAGLADLKNLKTLTHLDVRTTRVTAQGLEELQAALPKCRIEHDGGVLEPRR